MVATWCLQVMAQAALELPNQQGWCLALAEQGDKATAEATTCRSQFRAPADAR